MFELSGRAIAVGLEGGLLVVEDLLDDGVDLDDRPWSGDGLRLGLAGLVDDDGGALVEDAARGCIVLLSPCGQPVPGVNAPGMVALNDEGGLVPAWRCLQGGEDAAKDAIGESQTVEVGAVALLGVVVADAAPDVGTVGDGDVQEDEVRLVGVQQLGGVLLQINVGQEAMTHVEAAKVTVGSRGGPDLADHLLQRDVNVVGEGGILGHEAIEHVAVGPETVLDGIGVDGAVGVVPADSGGAPAGVLGIAEDSLRAVHRRPSGLGFVVDPQAVVEVVADSVDDFAGKQRRDDFYSVITGRLGVGEEGALGAEGVEVGEAEIPGAVLEGLVVGELVEDDPDQQRMIVRRLELSRAAPIPCGRDLVRCGLPSGDPKQLGNTAKGKNDEGGG